MYVEAVIEFTCCDKDAGVNAGGRLVDDETVILSEGTMFRFRELTAVRFAFLANALD